MTKLPTENKTNTWTLASLAALEDEMFAKHSTPLAHKDDIYVLDGDALDRLAKAK